MVANASAEQEEVPAWAAQIIAGQAASQASVQALTELTTTLTNSVQQVQLTQSEIVSRIETLESNPAPVPASGTVAEDELSDDDFVPHYHRDNPFASRPHKVGTKPQHYDLYGDRTADALETKLNSSMRY